MNWTVVIYNDKGRRTRVKLHAEYYKIDSDGSLIFRNSNCAGYPIPVHRFAPGHWKEVLCGNKG